MVLGLGLGVPDERNVGEWDKGLRGGRGMAHGEEEGGGGISYFISSPPLWMYMALGDSLILIPWEERRKNRAISPVVFTGLFRI